MVNRYSLIVIRYSLKNNSHRAFISLLPSN